MRVKKTIFFPFIVFQVILCMFTVFILEVICELQADWSSMQQNNLAFVFEIFFKNWGAKIKHQVNFQAAKQLHFCTIFAIVVFKKDISQGGYLCHAGVLFFYFIFLSKKDGGTSLEKLGNWACSHVKEEVHPLLSLRFYISGHNINKTKTKKHPYEILSKVHTTSDEQQHMPCYIVPLFYLFNRHKSKCRSRGWKN